MFFIANVHSHLKRERDVFSVWLASWFHVMPMKSKWGSSFCLIKDRMTKNIQTNQPNIYICNYIYSPIIYIIKYIYIQSKKNMYMFVPCTYPHLFRLFLPLCCSHLKPPVAYICCFQPPWYPMILQVVVVLCFNALHLFPWQTGWCFLQGECYTTKSTWNIYQLGHIIGTQKMSACWTKTRGQLPSDVSNNSLLWKMSHRHKW